MCICVYVCIILWYNGITAFSLESDSVGNILNLSSIKLGGSQVRETPTPLFRRLRPLDKNYSM